MTEQNKKGGISVETEHIFPVIKKWLYSEKDIFLREIVSNASDAVTKLKRLDSLGKLDSSIEENFRIDVILDKEAATLTVKDNGIGMTEDELSRYICQIALSGALDFIQKYEGESGAQNGIIGHFGLGFYSSFMVSDTVEIDTRSYTGEGAVHWVCNANGEYEISEGEREERGTTVVMHISDEEKEYLDKAKITEMLNKYCAFMPVEIFFKVEGEETVKDKDGNPVPEAPINDTAPLWLKNASDATDEEYNDFYRKVFSDYREPLFHVHINADYPLNFKGILYFPKIGSEFDSLEGQVKLYYNQVFVADNIKEVIPDYMLMLKGVIDCPELPLNVSRSYLQNNTYVSKVSAHIVKKIADKLSSLCTNEREKYESIWDDIRTFVEYACMRDRKFYDKAKSSLLFHLTDKSFVTLDAICDDAKEKNNGVIYYCTDTALQAQYIDMFTAKGIKVLLLDKFIDTQYIQSLESYNSEIKYVRVDADIAALKEEDNDKENTDGDKKNEAISALFKEASRNEELKIVFNSIAGSDIPAVLTVTEESRRMEEMMKMYSKGGMDGGMTFPLDYTLVVNSASPLTDKLYSLINDDNRSKAVRIASQIYRLAVLSQRKLNAEEMKDFLGDSYALLSEL